MIMTRDYITFPQQKIKKNYRSVTGHFPSVKNNKSIGFESLLEKHHFLYLEFDDNVILYYEQPQIKIHFNNRNMTYSLDCYIVRDQKLGLKDSLIEVKYTNEIDRRKSYFEDKFEATRKFAHEYDLEFDLFTEKSLNLTYLENIYFLYRYKLNPIEVEFEDEIISALKYYKKLTAFDLVKKITSNLIDYPIVSNFIWMLVVQKKIKACLDIEKLTMNSYLEIT